MIVESVVETRRERKSRFDVAPSAPLLQTQSEPSSCIVPPASDLESLRHVVDCKTKESYFYASCHESSFQRKLDIALEKNFQFIERIDRSRLIASAGGVATSSSGGNPSSRPKFAKLFSNAKLHPNKAGLGSKPEMPTMDNELRNWNRVYVNNLPKDMTEEEIGILFGPHGKIKKVKFYTDSSGNKKGDAMVSYASHEAAVLACNRLNGLDIGDGYTISVEKAEFQQKPERCIGDSALAVIGKFICETDTLQDGTDSLKSRCFMDSAIARQVRRLLPDEFRMESYNVVIVWNAFPNDANDDLIAELEMEVMIEACTAGDIEIIQPFVFTSLGDGAIDVVQDMVVDDPADSPQPQLAELNAVLSSAGTFVVSFKNEKTAHNCAVRMNGMTMRERMLTTILLTSHVAPRTEKENTDEETVNNLSSNDEIFAVPNVTADTNDLPEVDEQVTNEADDVDDFLNSLL